MANYVDGFIVPVPRRKLAAIEEADGTTQEKELIKRIIRLRFSQEQLSQAISRNAAAVGEGLQANNSGV